MSDIFEEVDEAVQQDKATKLWKNISGFVYVGIAALILGVAGYEVYGWQTAQKKEKDSREFFLAKSALDKKDYTLAEALFEEILASDSSFSEIAGNFLAETRLSGLGDKASALEALKKAAEGEGPYADIAQIKAGYLMSDSASVADLETYLAPVANNFDSPYKELAQEIVAARAFSLGDYDEAERRFEIISLAVDVSAGVRGRAERALIAIDAIKAKNGTPS